MKTRILLLLFLFLGYHFSTAQKLFEKGYIINQTGEKTTCFIKNQDRKKNPTQIEYKLTKEGEVNIGTLKAIKEFAFDSGSKYVRASVGVDRSESGFNKEAKREVSLVTETIFLKVLFEGKANLYKYEEGDFIKYFYSINDKEISQLIYKIYLNPNFTKGENETYKKQLFDDLDKKCASLDDIKDLSYTQRDLLEFFDAYNRCLGSGEVTYVQPTKPKLVNINIRAGYSYSSLLVDYMFENSIREWDSDFGGKSGIRVGVEAEIVSGFNRGKWALTLDPTYQSYSNDLRFNDQVRTVEYSSIELPVGIRHYMLLSQDAKLFINANYVLDVVLNSRLRYPDELDLESASKVNIAAGIGFNYLNRYSVELRYGFNRNILKDFRIFESEYRSISLMFGYTIL